MSGETVTTVLDLAGLVLVALGIGAALFPLIGFAAVAAVGLVLLAGSRAAVWISRPSAAPEWWSRMRGDRP